MIKFQCNTCGGSIIEERKFWVCENCGSKYALSRDDEGQPFIYQPVEKKIIECGQMAVKASRLEVPDIQVREIKLKDNINIAIHNESMNLDAGEIINNTEAFISVGEWEKVQEQINRLLALDENCAEAQWFNYMHSKKINSEKKMVETWTDFTESDKLRLDQMLANSSPNFAEHIIELMFNYAYSNDKMCCMILSAVLPYAMNEAIYNSSLLAEKIEKAFEITISKTYEESFLFLLTHTLQSDEVDRYIDYLTEFAEGCLPAVSQKYYQMIIDVDPGNLKIRRKLILADLRSDTYKGKCISDIEGLLGHSKNTDQEIYDIISDLNSEETTTRNKSDLFWELLGYHSKALDGLMNDLSKYAFILLNSSLWEEARKFLNLILSVNARCAKAYFGLCLIKIKARNETEISTRKDNLIDCSEFDKCLALYRAEGNKEMIDTLLSYTKKQKDTKQAKQFAIKVGIAVAVVILVIFSIRKISYYRKYSVNNIEISVTDKNNDVDSAYYGKYKTTLVLKIKSKSRKGIKEIHGEMKIYNSDGDLLLNANTNLNVNIEPKKKGETSLELSSSVTKDIEELYALDIENLKITFKVTSVIYDDYKSIEYPDSEKKVINEITEEVSYKEVKENRLNIQYQKAMEEYKNVDVGSVTFEDDIIKAISHLDEVWEDFLDSEKHLSQLYNDAMEYKNKGEYEKAYYLFALLSSANYSDSEYQMYECFDMQYAA